MLIDCESYRIYDSNIIVHLIIVCVHGVFSTKLELFKNKDFGLVYIWASHPIYWIGFVMQTGYGHTYH